MEFDVNAVIALVAIICGTVIVLVVAVLGYRDRQNARRERYMNTPLNKFGDTDLDDLVGKYSTPDDPWATPRSAERGPRTSAADTPRRPQDPSYDEHAWSQKAHDWASRARDAVTDTYERGKARVDHHPEGSSPRSKIVALLLCIVFGRLGFHYFYVNRLGMGVLYFVTGGLFRIGWIYDIVRIGLGEFPDDEGRKLR